MQTFWPCDRPEMTARLLDRARLGKQRIEARQILEVLLTKSRISVNPEISGSRFVRRRLGWANHPAVKMWHGQIHALAYYGQAICMEWIRRGYVDNQLPIFRQAIADFSGPELPPWAIDEDVIRGHRSNLLRKNPEHYSQFWPGFPNNLEYKWIDLT